MPLESDTIGSQKIRELEPIKESSEYYEEIEKQIVKLFKEEIYLPLLAELGASQKVLQNSLEDVTDAIKSGRISFYRGHFKGRFSSSISKELKKIGAKWNRKQGSWQISQSSLPPDIRSAIAVSESRFKQVLKKIDDKLAQFLPEQFASKVSFEKYFDSALFKIDGAFKKTLKGISVATDLTDVARQKIAREYTQNLEKYIRDFADEEIINLRKEMQKQVFAGVRYEAAISTIKKSYGVSERKAKFLARQETSLMMAKFKESRYADVGIKEYYWMNVVGSPNHPVRPMHKALGDASKKGKIFSFDNPPVTDEHGNRNNPGEDFNCRCYAKPIIRF